MHFGGMLKYMSAGNVAARDRVAIASIFSTAIVRRLLLPGGTHILAEAPHNSSTRATAKAEDLVLVLVLSGSAGTLARGILAAIFIVVGTDAKATTEAPHSSTASTTAQANARGVVGAKATTEAPHSSTASTTAQANARGVVGA
eukprot:CAMPEP_0178497104 /NCGR_PEP_ID=MMETSP0696-20121128/14495_1 /TAXON_ID=265572 /ORGANISM="Extubocellulus spinifer, Strain CCMP396" /LENGTH=143 /DNA_ID=CAMNT_0020125477 /DNA_START=408 /DNA_END=836 /DNA_ORIENTATION=+